jgi:hypothetical protein
MDRMEGAGEEESSVIIDNWELHFCKQRRRRLARLARLSLAEHKWLCCATIAGLSFLSCDVFPAIIHP